MTKHNNIVVLLDGTASTEPCFLEFAMTAYVIAADGGIRHAEKLGVVPDLWIGDFDSTDVQLQEQFENVPHQKFSADKIKSDGELAIEHALTYNPEKLILFGALGGKRTDHILFNILGTLRLAKANQDTEFLLIGDNQIAFPLIEGKTEDISRYAGKTISVVPFSDLRGLTITGVRWPLDEVDVAMGSTHTLSNVITADATVCLSFGHAIAIVQTNE